MYRSPVGFSWGRQLCSGSTTSVKLSVFHSCCIDIGRNVFIIIKTLWRASERAPKKPHDCCAMNVFVRQCVLDRKVSCSQIALEAMLNDEMGGPIETGCPKDRTSGSPDPLEGASGEPAQIRPGSGP